jgi:hypothetical protein
MCFWFCEAHSNKWYIKMMFDFTLSMLSCADKRAMYFLFCEAQDNKCYVQIILVFIFVSVGVRSWRSLQGCVQSHVLMAGESHQRQHSGENSPHTLCSQNSPLILLEKPLSTFCFFIFVFCYQWIDFFKPENFKYCNSTCICLFWIGWNIPLVTIQCIKSDHMNAN